MGLNIGSHLLRPACPAMVSVGAGHFLTPLLSGLLTDLLWPMECGESGQYARPKPRP